MNDVYVDLCLIYFPAPEYSSRVYKTCVDCFDFCFIPAPEYFRVGFLHCHDFVFVVSVIMLVEEMRRPSRYIPLFE